MSSTRKTASLACILITALLPCGLPISAQGLGSLLPGAKSKAGTPVIATDPLNRTTPRDSIYNFLEACHRGNYLLASQYLDLRKISSGERASRGPELARELGELLDRDPNFEVEQLSKKPEGNTEDELSPDLDNLATFQSNGQGVSLQMQRVTQQGVSLWLVAADSVSRIPELSRLIGESQLEKKLPQPLVKIRFVGTPLWAWLALVLLALVLSLVSRLLSKLFIALVKPFLKRYAKSFQTYRLEAFTEPLRLLLSVAVFRACMQFVDTSALLRNYLLQLIALLIVLGIAAFAMRVVDVLSDQAISRLDPRERALSYSVVPLFVRFVKICIFVIAVLLILEHWGLSIGTILAGVGVGGLAIALAAQKTLENLFGSISVITDRPVLVGDVCKFGGQVGTVEDIGLRSTRIRTPDRTVVTIPNAQFSTMTLENYSRRDRMWFHPTLRLRRGTRPEQIREMMDAVTKILEEHPMVDASGVPLRFTNISDQSFDLEVFSYVLTADYNEYLKVQSELLLKILAAAAERKVGFAVPFQESISVTEQAGCQFQANAGSDASD